MPPSSGWCGVSILYDEKLYWKNAYYDNKTDEFYARQLGDDKGTLYRIDKHIIQNWKLVEHLIFDFQQPFIHEP